VETCEYWHYYKMNNSKKIHEILSFWFEETTPKQHFAKDDAFDTEVKTRFEETYWDIMNGKTIDWRESPEGRLAEIIVLDQFARNMFRDTPQSFAADDLALQLADEALSVGADQEVPKEMRVFFYMPFMHSESEEVHKKALKIFEDYGNAENLKYELMHKKIIDRFGRYPHRNKTLERESTPEDIDFLKEHSGF